MIVSFRTGLFRIISIVLCLLAGSESSLLAAISDHVLQIDISQEKRYENALDENDIEYTFSLDLETDANVNLVEFLTPAGNTFTIPDIEDNWDGDIQGGTWTRHAYDADDDVWEWEYYQWGIDRQFLDDFGDGWYAITVHYQDGSQEQTNVWFGVTGTSDRIPQPTQRPIMMIPASYGSPTSPVTISWQQCTDPNANKIFVSLENWDTWEQLDNDLALSDTSWDLLTLSDGFWKAEVCFDNTGGLLINNDGIQYDILKAVSGIYWFAVGKPWAAHEVWGGNTAYTSADTLLNIDETDYVKLGESEGGTETFMGNHMYYVIGIRQRHLKFDAFQGSDNSYYGGDFTTGNVHNPGNIEGVPDNRYALAGLWQTPDTFRSYIRLTNPGTWTGLTVITGLPSLTGDFCGANFGPADGYVDVWDLMQFSDHWHIRTGEGSWDATFDLAGPNFGDADGYIDVWDLMLFADHWHEGEKP